MLKLLNYIFGKLAGILWLESKRDMKRQSSQWKVSTSVALFSSFNMENGVAGFISNLASLWFRRALYFQNWKVKIVYCDRQKSGSQKCPEPYHWNLLLYYLTQQRGTEDVTIQRILGYEEESGLSVSVANVNTGVFMWVKRRS